MAFYLRFTTVPRGVECSETRQRPGAKEARLVHCEKVWGRRLLPAAPGGFAVSGASRVAAGISESPLSLELEISRSKCWNVGRLLISVLL